MIKVWSQGFHVDLETDISKTGKPRSLPFLFWKNNTSVNVQKRIKLYDQCNMGWPFSISTLLSQMERCEKEMIAASDLTPFAGVLRKYSQILFENGRKSILSPAVHSD